MNGKEQFKEVRNSHLDNIMTEYSVDKDTAYQALAKALDNPMVLNAISKAVADTLTKEKKEIPVSPFESWVDQFLKQASRTY